MSAPTVDSTTDGGSVAPSRTPAPQRRQLFLPLIDGEVLVFDLDDVKALRALGILGTAIGSLAVAPQQNNYLGLPIKLSRFEVVWLLIHKNAVLVDNSDVSSTKSSTDDNYLVTPYTTVAAGADLHKRRLIATAHFLDSLSSEFKSEFSTFNTLKSLGYFLLPGLKFGGKFLAYPGDPLRFHSHLIVNTANELSTMQMVVGGRLATGVKKLWVIMEAKNNDDLQSMPGLAFSIEWSGFG